MERLWIGLGISLGLACVQATACSVPVFRYALERWRSDLFEVVLVHRGSLTAEQEAIARALDPDADVQPGAETGPVAANVEFHRLDARAEPPMELAGLRRQLPADLSLPAVTVRFPRLFGNPAVLWSVPLSSGAVRQILDSPVRRDLARRLIRGDSAVWVFLDIGDPARDDPAAALLQKRLGHLEKTLQLQSLDPADVAGGLVSVPEDKLRVAFSMVRVSRRDPAEQFLIRMLLDIEEDLREFKEPIAFPVFGRGRALFALVGKGIVEDNIDEACHFLTGPCSCQAKALNPGVDLLMAVDWDEEVETMAVNTRELPELSGVAGFGTGTVSAAARSPAEPAEPVAAPPAPAAPPAAARQGYRPLVTGLAVAGGAALLIVAGGTVLLLRRKGG